MCEVDNWQKPAKQKQPERSFLPNPIYGLCLCFRRDQHGVVRWFDGDGDAEQGSERGMGRAPPIEAEDEFVEVGLEMRATEAVVGAQRPCLEV